MSENFTSPVIGNADFHGSAITANGLTVTLVLGQAQLLVFVGDGSSNSMTLSFPSSPGPGQCFYIANIDASARTLTPTFSNGTFLNAPGTIAANTIYVAVYNGAIGKWSCAKM